MHSLVFSKMLQGIFNFEFEYLHLFVRNLKLAIALIR